MYVADPGSTEPVACLGPLEYTGMWAPDWNTVYCRCYRIPQSQANREQVWGHWHGWHLGLIIIRYQHFLETHNGVCDPSLLNHKQASAYSGWHASSQSEWHSKPQTQLFVFVVTMSPQDISCSQGDRFPLLSWSWLGGHWKSRREEYPYSQGPTGPRAEGWAGWDLSTNWGEMLIEPPSHIGFTTCERRPLLTALLTTSYSPLFSIKLLPTESPSRACWQTFNSPDFQPRGRSQTSLIPTLHKALETLLKTWVVCELPGSSKQSEPSLLTLGPWSNWNLGGHGDYRVKKKRTEFVVPP